VEKTACPVVVEGHDLGEERAGDVLHRVEPEVAVVTEGLPPCILVRPSELHGGPCLMHDVTNAEPLNLCHKAKLRYALPRISSERGQI
jgi:hypothetical protein